jgi:peptidoglycan/xylan/chitin deacetylase (PgdA/CDA1 family)
MKYSFHKHNIKHLTKAVLGRIEYSIHGVIADRNELVVLNYHGVQQKFLKDFSKQIAFFNEHFEFATIADLDDILSKRKKGKRPFLLLTFDDGIKNNLLTIEVLDKYNIKCIFFIIPEFVNTPSENQKTFFLKNIRPEINSEVDNAIEDFSALSWSDLKILISKGHSVGSHTMSHSLLKGGTNNAAIEYEILASKKEIENQLGITVKSFCSPNNTLESIGEKELRLICSNYDYHFTTIPGSNIGASPYFIRRVNIEAHWMKGAVIRATGEWDRKRWKSREMTFISLLDSIGAYKSLKN